MLLFYCLNWVFLKDFLSFTVFGVSEISRNKSQISVDLCEKGVSKVLFRVSFDKG